MVSLLIVSMALFAPGQQPAAQARPTAAAAQPDNAALLAEYNVLSAKAADTADAHWKLGLWCEQKGLKAEAEAQFMLVAQLDPRREAALKKLGYVKHNGRWTTPEQVAAERAEIEAQRQADARWRPILQKWKAALARKDKRAEAESALGDVKDPRATPSIWKVFATGSPDAQERAIDMLGHIEGEQASRALAGLAIFGKTELVRRDAVETLKRRKADDVLVSWIGLLRPPIKYEVRQVAGPGSPGVLFVEGQKFNIRGFYAPPSVFQTQALFVDPLPPEQYMMPLLKTDSKPPPRPPLGSKFVGIGPEGIELYVFDYTWAPPPPPPPPPGPTQAYQEFEKSLLQAQVDRDFAFGEAGKMAAGAQAQLEHDVNMVEQSNALIRETNARVSAALSQVAGKDLGDDREAWMKWWMKRKGYTYSPPKDIPKPTVDVQVALPYAPQSGPPRMADGGGPPTSAYCMIWMHFKDQVPIPGRCLAAGTLVLTPDGHRPIETLRAGDLVVTADGSAGSRQTCSIVSIHVGPAARTIRLVVNDEALVTSEGHPFMKPGTGWTRAADLQPGDEVLTIDGKARVENTEAGERAIVWNLRLAGGATFLVGRLGVVVHDITPIASVGLLPFPAEGIASHVLLTIQGPRQ
jgi:hypothetical protein